MNQGSVGRPEEAIQVLWQHSRFEAIGALHPAHFLPGVGFSKECLTVAYSCLFKQLPCTSMIYPKPQAGAIYLLLLRE